MKKAKLYASTFIIEDNLMWFVPVRYNYLCCYNLETEEVEKKFRLPEGNYYTQMYDNILSYGDKFYLIPFNGGDVLVFNKVSEEFERILLAPYNSLEVKFYAATIYKEKLYLFPARARVGLENPYIILKIDLSGKTDIKTEIIDLPMLSMQVCARDVFDRNYFIRKNKLYILLWKTNKVLEYDLDTDKRKIFEVGDSKNEYSTMYMKENKCYLINQSGNVTIWNERKNSILEYCNEIEDYIVEENKSCATFSFGFEYGDSVCFIPRFANKVITFDGELITESFYSNDILKCDKRMELLGVMGRYLHAVLKQDKLYLWDLYSYKFYLINLNKKTCKSRMIEAWFDDNDLKKLYKEFRKNQTMAYPENISSYSNLEFYLHQILLEGGGADRGSQEENIGKEILQRII